MKRNQSQNGKPQNNKSAEGIQGDNNGNISPVQEARDQLLGVVCIGGSAGSVQAIEKFFKNLPPDSQLSFVVVQHLDPTQKGLMPELITRWTNMKVFEVENGMQVLPNTVYVIPPNKEMSIVNGILMLFDPSRPRGFRMPIDIFMESLAQDQGEKSVAIILSGLDSDGVQGAGFIKEAFGMVMVQAPETTLYNSMPIHTIEKDLVDYIGAPEELPKKLVDYFKKPAKLPAFKDDEDSTEKYNIALQKIFVILKNYTGHDFSFYKRNTIHRRIERRMNTNQISNILQYVKFLQSNPEELEKLFKELLIGVTKFFRDPEAFELLKTKVFPQIIRNKSKGEPLRIWSTGVSTGEEIYSIAITLLECLEVANNKRISVQIFATDLDEEAIETARAGIFLANISADVSLDRLERYFIKEGDCYRIKKEVRELIIFANHNLIKDAPFTKLDLVICRNLLIYLTPELQKKVLPLFHYALNPEGYLFLGPSESLGNFQDLFHSIDQKWKIFKKKEGDSFKMMDFPFYFSTSEIKNKLDKLESHMVYGKKTSFATIVHTVLLEKYGPPSVLINQAGDILYLHGKTGKYLDLPAGNAQMNIYQMAKNGLKYELSSTILKASAQKDTAVVSGVKIKGENNFQYINLIVIYVSEPPEVKGLLLVVFEDIEVQVKDEAITLSIGKAAKRDQLISHLEKELEYTKLQLQTTLEEMESSFEEIKSANEELQSTNEELQSINEESISAKEEMQSLNEELMAVNIDYQTKTDELTVANNDMKNLLDSTAIATIFIDNKLNIKRYTPEAVKIFNIIPTDIGRPIAHVVNNLKYRNLLRDIDEVIDKLTPKETIVEAADNKWYHMRLFPYRTISNYIDGVVITFSDITQQKELEEQLNETILFTESIIDSVRDPLVILNPDFKVMSVSKTFANLFGLNPKHIKGEYLHVLDQDLLSANNLRDAIKGVVSKGVEFNDVIIEKEFPIVGRKKLLFNGRPIAGNHNGNNKMILLAIEDITDK
jgi:two-component system, chemotaxis family, CheB/CheR fusion protein